MSTSGRRRWWAAGAALAFGGVLLALFVVVWRLDAALLLDALTRLRPLTLAGVAATFAVHIGCSAWKWGLVDRRLDPGANRSWLFYATFSAVAAAVAQVLTVHVASVVVREIAVRAEGGRSLEGAGGSLVEQVFDVAVLIAFVTATGAWALWGGSWWMWIGAAAVVGTLAVPTGQAIVAPQARWLGTRLARGPGVVRKLGDLLTGPGGQVALQPRLGLALWAISVVRYVAIGVRTALVASALGLTLMPVLQALTVVQASQLAALTPGNLGVTEWTWGGVLAALGESSDDAAILALTLRMLLAASVVIFAVVALGTRVVVNRVVAGPGPSR